MKFMTVHSLIRPNLVTDENIMYFKIEMKCGSKKFEIELDDFNILNQRFNLNEISIQEQEQLIQTFPAIVLHSMFTKYFDKGVLLRNMDLILECILDPDNFDGSQNSHYVRSISYFNTILIGHGIYQEELDTKNIEFILKYL